MRGWKKVFQRVISVVLIVSMMSSLTGCVIYVDYDALNEVKNNAINSAKEKAIELYDNTVGSVIQTVNHQAQDIKGKFDRTIIEIFGGNKYYVTYDGNAEEVENVPENNPVKYRKSISEERPTRKGYHFLGWAKQADASEVFYKAGDKLDEECDVTLYAIWENVTELEANSNISNYHINGDKEFPSKNESEYKNRLRCSCGQYIREENLDEYARIFYENKRFKLNKPKDFSSCEFKERKEVLKSYILQYDIDEEWVDMLLGFTNESEISSNDFLHGVLNFSSTTVSVMGVGVGLANESVEFHNLVEATMGQELVEYTERANDILGWGFYITNMIGTLSVMTNGETSDMSDEEICQTLINGLKAATGTLPFLQSVYYSESLEAISEGISLVCKNAENQERNRELYEAVLLNANNSIIAQWDYDFSNDSENGNWEAWGKVENWSKGPSLNKALARYGQEFQSMNQYDKEFFKAYITYRYKYEFEKYTEVELEQIARKLHKMAD